MQLRIITYCVVVAFYLFLLPCHSQEVALSSLSSSAKKTLEHSPLGDYLHVEVYDFIIQELLKAPSISKEEVKKRAEEEAEIFASKEPLKPGEVTVAEGSFSHILNALCAYHKTCLNICVYQKDGLAIGITSIDNEFNNIKPRISYQVLSDDPISKLGIRLLKKEGQTKYYEAVQAIYLKNNIASLALQKTSDPYQILVGFVRHTFKDTGVYANR